LFANKIVVFVLNLRLQSGVNLSIRSRNVWADKVVQYDTLLLADNLPLNTSLNHQTTNNLKIIHTIISTASTDPLRPSIKRLRHKVDKLKHRLKGHIGLLLLVVSARRLAPSGERLRQTSFCIVPMWTNIAMYFKLICIIWEHWKRGSGKRGTWMC